MRPLDTGTRRLSSSGGGCVAVPHVDGAHTHFTLVTTACFLRSLWPPIIRQAVIFLPCGFFYFLLSIYLLFSSPNPTSRRVDVYHPSTHGVALVRI